VLSAFGLVSLVATVGCAKDVILPVAQVCGNLKQEGTEECDLASEGCVQCKVAKGFTCNDETCTATCGDSVVAGDEECDPPDGIQCDSECRAGEKTEVCDMTGYWVVRQTDFSVDDVLSQVQTSSNWYVFHLTQTDTAFQVDQAIFCGIHVSGSATVDLTLGGIRGLMWFNPQDKDTPPPRSARKGTFSAMGDGCNFAMDRNYMVRGADASLLPTDFLAKPDLATLPPLPHEDDPEHPTGTNLDGAVDSDGDGHPGVAFQITGNANAVRNVAQRDWNEYSTPPGKPIAANSIEFTADCTFDNQENILVVSRCPLIGCGILLASSTPAKNLQDRVTFRYLGKDLTEPRVARVIVADLKTDEDSDLQTCENVRNTLVHDSSSK